MGISEANVEEHCYLRRDVNIANRTYGHNKGAAMGRFKHPREGIKMNRTTEDDITPEPPTIMEHNRKIHLDMYLLFVNKIPFLLTKSRNIRFIHCKAMHL